jgi:hypothetical protein
VLPPKGWCFPARKRPVLLHPLSPLIGQGIRVALPIQALQRVKFLDKRLFQAYF